MAQNNAPNAAATSASPANTSTISQTPLRDNIRSVLQRSGFSDIRIMPSSFMIRAKDQQGNPVIMSVGPDSVTEISELGTSGGNGPSDNGANASTSGASGPQFVSVGQNEKLSSNLVGLDVCDASNQSIGPIKARTRLHRVCRRLPWHGHALRCHEPVGCPGLIQYSDQKWHAVTNATSDQLKSAPAFQYTGRWDASKS
jgi:hypothetical protein